ncbi:hypothetical protein X759_05375 [Mesorhizobium sp. LSHC420B00]|nr:hypothetical protein X759_05375 [Mesorhizobium sp. LSHC420B00]
MLLLRTADCTDMRHSKMCKGDLNCGSGKCSCTAALVVDPGPKTPKPKVVAPKATTKGVVKQ